MDNTSTPQLSLTPLGHSCVLVALDGPANERTLLLLDPGTLTPPLEPIPELDAVLITHAHVDHVDADQIRRATGGEAVPVYGDAATAGMLDEQGLGGTQVITPGIMTIGHATVEVSEWTHEEVYPGVPVPPDLGFLIASRIFAPGDSFAVPPFDVDVLLLPTGAPWMKVGDTLDYMRAVAPAIVVPVHDGGLADAHRQMHRNLMENFAPERTRVLRPDLGERLRFD